MLSEEEKREDKVVKKNMATNFSVTSGVRLGKEYKLHARRTVILSSINDVAEKISLSNLPDEDRYALSGRILCFIKRFAGGPKLGDVDLPSRELIVDFEKIAHVSPVK